MKAAYLVAVLTILAVSFQSYGDIIVANPSMEGNFNNGVAEGWTAWNSGSGGSYVGSGSAYDGSQSQCFMAMGEGGNINWGMGIYQQMTSLQIGEIYDVSAWFMGDFSVSVGGGMPTGNCVFDFSIGIDPSNGTDPSAEEWTTISSSRSSFFGEWVQVTTSFIAVSDTTTLFIRSTGFGRGEAIYPWLPPFPMLGPASGMTATINIDDVSVVPEPATMCLLGLGALGLIRKRNR